MIKTGKYIIGVIRIELLLVLVVFGLIAGLFSTLFPRQWYLKLANIWHGLVLAIIGLSVRFSGEDFNRGSLLVSNHISWLDISVIGSKLPVVFLAKNEIAGWPVLGFLIKKAGTLFIEQGKGAKVALQALSSTLSKNQSVHLFPEGKTTDGKDVIKFQPRLLQSSIDAGVPLQPIAIRYLDSNDQKVDHISYIGNVSFLQSLWRTVCGQKVYAEIKIFPVVSGCAERSALAAQAESMVREWVIN